MVFGNSVTEGERFDSKPHQPNTHFNELLKNWDHYVEELSFQSMLDDVESIRIHPTKESEHSSQVNVASCIYTEPKDSDYIPLGDEIDNMESNIIVSD